MFDMSYFIDRELHLHLKKLGRTQWLDFCALGLNPEGKLQGAIDVDINAVRRATSPAFADLVRAYWNDGDTLCLMAAVGRCLVDGPKVLRPDFDTCLALESIDIDLPVEDYAQPFEVILIRLPTAWVDRIRARCGNTNRYDTLMVWHDVKTETIFLCVFGPQASKGMRTTIRPRVEAPTLESQLRRHNDHPDYLLGEIYQRLALNLGLLMTHVGVSTVGWLAPRDRAKHERLARQGDERGQMLAAGDVAEISLQQAIKLYSVITLQGPEGAAGGGSHASPRPHWRRGHWRNQQHGPGRVERKRILIPATFVRSHSGIDPSQVAVDYELSTLPNS